MSFRIVDLIESKKRGEEHSHEQLSWLVDGFTHGEIPDYQMSAWLMAVCLRGMTDDETISLTRVMVETGKILDLSKISGAKLDKHSSGGVGDKVTLAFVPILSAAGAKIAKMSGHGLGFTGGTLDKLESIKGFRTALTETEIIDQVEKIGACICAQTETLAPADRVIYALRDVTATVDSIPLIASSIMSKKIACGADIILLDIKVGSGAFMKTLAEARELAKLCVKIGKSCGKNMIAFLTDMNQPLGRGVGNFVEVNEARDLLAGKDVDTRFLNETLTLCNAALELIGSHRMAANIIESGDAAKKFGEIIQAQSTQNQLAQIKVWHSTDLTSDITGYVTSVDALKVGHAAALVGAGRLTKSDSPDYYAGIWLDKVAGDKVEQGENLATFHASHRSAFSDEAKQMLASAFTFSSECPAESSSPILERID